MDWTTAEDLQVIGVNRKMLKSKIHCATVTDCNVLYEGSITIDKDLMEAANILPFEAVAVWNVSNGNRFETYAIEGNSGSGIICVNGAAAHLVRTGEKVIIATFASVPEEKAREHRPTIVLVDDSNRVTAVKSGS